MIRDGTKGTSSNARRPLANDQPDENVVRVKISVKLCRRFMGAGFVDLRARIRGAFNVVGRRKFLLSLPYFQVCSDSRVQDPGWC